MELDSATKDLMAEMAKMELKPLEEYEPKDARATMAGLAAMYGQGPEMAREFKHILSVDQGEIELQVLIPSKNPEAIILYLHGGGWVLGSVAEYFVFGQTLARASNAVVVLVDYRKAPEFPFPIPVNDSYAALEWANANIEALAGRAVPLIVAGDSAGGNLSAVLCHKAKSENGPKIDLQVLAYPPTTADNFDNSSYNNPENQLMFSKGMMTWFWNHYVPDLNQRKDPYASPLLAPHFEGLPAAVVLTAGFDLLRDEGEAYTAKLVQAGVPVIFRRFEDQMHGFLMFVNVLPGSEKGIAFIVDSIKCSLRN